MRITRPRATKLSQITIDADLDMGAHSVKTDIVAESTEDAGVAVDGVANKDGKIPLSDVTPDANLDMGPHDVTTNVGTLDIGDMEKTEYDPNDDGYVEKINILAVPSDAKVYIDPGPQSTNSTTYVKLYEKIVPSYYVNGSKFRISFTHATSSGTQVTAVFKNDVLYGTEYSHGPETIERHDDLAFVAGDKIQIYMKTTASVNPTVTDFSVGCTFTGVW